MAYDLAKTALTNAFVEMPRHAREVHAQLRGMVQEMAERLSITEKDIRFRRRDIREYTKLPDHSIKRAMRSLEDLEYVHARCGGRGGSHLYQLASCPKEKDPLEGLTTPAEVEQKWNKGLVPLLTGANS